MMVSQFIVGNPNKICGVGEVLFSANVPDTALEPTQGLQPDQSIQG
jgi:hypothetical protein